MQFTWIPEKAAKNLEKHGVSFEEAAEVFDDPQALVRFDEQHSSHLHERYHQLGATSSGRVLLVVFTEDEKHDIIHVISARPAQPHEVRRYERQF